MATRFHAPAHRPIDDTRLSALAVSDDPFALDRLDALLGGMGVAVDCLAWHGKGDAERIRQSPADVLLIEATLGRSRGMALGASFLQRCAPVVLLSTGTDAAASAFDAGAEGYLVKPLDRARVERAIERVRVQHEQRRNGARAADARRQIEAIAAREERAAVWVRPRRGEWLRVRGDTIDWLQVQDDYVCLHTKDREHLVRGSLDHWLDVLGRDRFMRIHRRIAVAIDRVARLSENVGAQVELQDGTRLPVGRVHGRSLVRLT